ncbi:hypothetical protein [Alicyclobacillus acidiphilus]|uniref:hypothetical protein n=1 Tax=Alicyclobacillus acidiphilus TaxID=182455 RepID=UPI000A515CEA|nr:hypothetical protein [Alicyclobacillus acidiphilus]
MNDKRITRREFLMALGGLELIGLGSYPFIRSLVPGSPTPLVLPQRPTIPWNGTVKSFVLNLSRGDVTLRDSRWFSGYLINGQFPGPEIRVRVGDKVG